MLMPIIVMTSTLCTIQMGYSAGLDSGQIMMKEAMGFQQTAFQDDGQSSPIGSPFQHHLYFLRQFLKTKKILSCFWRNSSLCKAEF